MRVKATKLGHFGALRFPGTVFDVPDGTKPATWFEPVDPPAEPAADQVLPHKGKKVPDKAPPADPTGFM